MEAYTTTRFFFTSLADAVEALSVVLDDARNSDKDYSFGSTSPKQILSSGLILSGDISDVVTKIENLGIGIRHDE